MQLHTKKMSSRRYTLNILTSSLDINILAKDGAYLVDIAMAVYPTSDDRYGRQIQNNYFPRSISLNQLNPRSSKIYFISVKLILKMINDFFHTFKSLHMRYMRIDTNNIHGTDDGILRNVSHVSKKTVTSFIIWLKCYYDEKTAIQF